MLVGRGGGTVASFSEVLYLGTYAVSARARHTSVCPPLLRVCGRTKLWLQFSLQ